MSKSESELQPFMADISFLQPIIDAYKIGLFADIKAVRVQNALDSLSWYGNVKHYRGPAKPGNKTRHYQKYKKKSEYWKHLNSKGEQ